MELITAIVAFVVFIADRLALCIMLYMLLTWVIGIFEQPLRRLHRRVLEVVSGLRWVREAVQFWTALRLVRRQLVP